MGQLARELNQDPRQVLSWLREQNQPYTHTGAQLPGDIEDLVRKNFERGGVVRGAAGRPTEVALPPAITVRELGDQLKVGAVDIIKDLLKNGISSNINQQLDFETAAIVADNFGVTATPAAVATQAERDAAAEGEAAETAPQPKSELFTTEADDPAPPLRNPVRAALGGLAMGVRNRNFWLLSVSFFICGASTNGLIGTHLIPASMDHGLPEVTAASLLAVIGIFDVAGTMISGWLTDRVDSRWLLFWYYGLRGLSLLFLPYAFGVQYFGLILFIVFYGLDWVATVPPTVALAADTFGKRNVGVVYGWIFASHQLGAAAAAFGAGAVRTFFGDYQLAFTTSGLLCLLAAGLVIRISRARGPEAVAAPLATPAPSY